MTTATNPIEPQTSEKELVITRLFDAPRDLVWKACTEAESLKHWWGPKGFTMLSCSIDLRPDGLFHYGMRSPDGREMWGKWIFRDVVAPERLVYVVSFSDAKGGTTRHPMSATWPLEVLSSMSFTEENGKTTLTCRSRPINASNVERETFETNFEGMKQGFAGTFDQLGAYLAKA